MKFNYYKHYINRTKVEFKDIVQRKNGSWEDNINRTKVEFKDRCIKIYLTSWWDINRTKVEFKVIPIVHKFIIT